MEMYEVHMTLVGILFFIFTLFRPGEGETVEKSGVRGMVVVSWQGRTLEISRIPFFNLLQLERGSFEFFRFFCSHSSFSSCFALSYVGGWVECLEKGIFGICI